MCYRPVCSKSWQLSITMVIITGLYVTYYSFDRFQFQAVEEPVRRKVMTSSLAGKTTVGDAKISTNRGFELVPGEVFFGELREGCTYAMVIHLKNIGIDSCRYKVKQPPPATGLQVIYKPGPVSI